MNEIVIESLKARLNALENSYIEAVFNLTQRITDLERQAVSQRNWLKNLADKIDHVIKGE